MGRATHPHAYYMIAGREKLSGRVRDPTDRVASRRHIGARECHRTGSTALFGARPNHAKRARKCVPIPLGSTLCTVAAF